MKRSVVAAAVLGFLVMVLVPSHGFSAEKGSYFLVKPGAYFPGGDLHDSGFGTAFIGELVVGRYYNPNLAFEGGVGYFQSSASTSGAASTSLDNKIWVIPVTASLKGVIPFRGGEVTAGGGIGVYFATMETKMSSPSLNSTADSSSAAFGGHALVGISLDISPSMFIGAEGKYIITTKADFFDTKMNLNGFMLTGVLGYRF